MVKLKEIYLAGGCYWGVEHLIKQLRGVVLTEVGFANGTTENPTYEEVYTDTTGFAETVHVVYDASRLRLFTLLHIFFDHIDPTSLNRQGEDLGTRYRTGIYTTDTDDLEVAQAVRDERRKEYELPIVVEIEPLKCFYKADESHQQYLEKNPSGYCHISLDAIRKAKSLNRKVYFAGSIRGGRTDADLYQTMIHRLQRHHLVLTEHVGDLTLSTLEDGENRDALIYQQDTDWIKESDFLVAECTNPSLGVGYELAFAELHQKPCFVFFDENRTSLSAMIGGNDYFKVIPYFTVEELLQKIEELF